MATPHAVGHRPNRRDMLAATGLAAAISLAGGPARATTATKPNIVYILADDLGWADLGYRGSDIRTPSIDRLAASGRRLEGLYTQPLCTPTRAALMTGRYPLRFGLQMGVIPSGGKYGLATDEVTLPQMLKGAGYKTALVGKWHLGHYDTEYWPMQRGFDHFYGALIGEIDHFKHTSHDVLDWYHGNTRVEETGYDTDLFGAEAVRLINGHDTGTPLFLYLAFTAPHTPYQAPADAEAQYAHIKDPQRRAYAAMVTRMDEQIGRVAAALDKRGMRDNTLIIFHSDNGGTRSKMFVGEGAVEGELPASNGPYREGKGTLYEGGVRVGGIANWPGTIAPGQTDGLIHVTDMLPTLASLTGASTAASKPLDGVNAWPLLSGTGASPRTGLIVNVDPTEGSVRDGRWKLVWLAALPSRVQLFDLVADPGEKTDVATAHPDTVARLQEQVTKLATEMQPPFFALTALEAALAMPPNMPSGLGQPPAAPHH